jgi:hypothetical protein
LHKRLEHYKPKAFYVIVSRSLGYKMFMQRFSGLFPGVALAVIAYSADAAVIPGPTLTHGYSSLAGGIGFEALTDLTLTNFTYQNQGMADTVVLTNSTGTVLDSLSIPEGASSYAATVSWALTAGDQYWLLQTDGPNGFYTLYGAPLPSNADIQIVQSGTFGSSVSDAIANAGVVYIPNFYWANFNNITTTSAATPEASTWAMMLLGFIGLGSAGYRGMRKNITVTG